jgi:hypothetical protein
MRNSAGAAALVTALCVFVVPGAGAETTFCTHITSLPYVISAQGSYCLDRSLSTSQTTGAAITVNTDFVTIDLNSFKIGGGAAGLGTNAVGVYALNRKNVVIRNGNIRGFLYGIQLTGGTSQAHIVEDMRLDENTFTGIYVNATGSTIRRNSVVKTGGSTAIMVTAAGIWAVGNGIKVIDNSVDNTGAGVGGVAIALQGSLMTVVNNRVSVAETQGISCSGSHMFLRDNIVLGTNVPFGADCTSPNLKIDTANNAAIYPYP